MEGKKTRRDGVACGRGTAHRQKLYRGEVRQMKYNCVRGRGLPSSFWLLISHAFNEKSIVSSEIYQKLLFGKLEVNEGMLIENIVAQMLAASGNNLFFYSKSSEEAEERMEIDFLLQKEKVTSRHNIRPVEVKSGKNYTLSSLTKCMKKFGDHITTPTVLHTADYKVVDGITYLPIYMTPLL